MRVLDEINPQKVRCYGAGVEPQGVRLGQPAPFAIDCSEAGQAPLEVTTTDPTGELYGLRHKFKFICLRIWALDNIFKILRCFVYLYFITHKLHYLFENISPHSIKKDKFIINILQQFLFGDWWEWNYYN